MPQLFSITISLILFTGFATRAQDNVRPEGLMAREDGAYDGYTLIAPLRSNSIFLLNMAGSEVHRWDLEHTPGASTYLLDNGHLLRCARVPNNPVFRGGGIGGRIQEVDWDGKLVWDYPLADEHITQHHDCAPMPNGDVLVIVWERLSAGVAEGAGRDPAALSEHGMWPDAILQLRPIPPNDAEVVWEWHAWDHLIQDHDSSQANFGVISDHPERINLNADLLRPPPPPAEARRRAAEMDALGYLGGGPDGGHPEGTAPGGSRPNGDWLHTNSIAYNAKFDLILLSTPRLHEVWVLDHSTTTEEAAGKTGGRWNRGGDLLYRWGNPAAYGQGRSKDQRLFSQHDARWLQGPDDELRLTIFNNGRGRPGGNASSVDELRLPFDRERGFTREDGKPFGPLNPSWTYRDDDGFFASFISGAQRLPNGNTLVCSGPQGRVFEITPDGHIVWDYWNTHEGKKREKGDGERLPAHALFRATRIAPDHPGLSQL
jgi:hypothetical protein